MIKFARCHESSYSSLNFSYLVEGLLSRGCMRQFLESKIGKVRPKLSILKWQRLVAVVTVENE